MRVNRNVINDSLLVGNNLASGDSIKINFYLGDINRIQVFGGAMGEFLPEGKNLGIKISYAEQKYPRGLPDAFLIWPSILSIVLASVLLFLAASEQRRSRHEMNLDFSTDGKFALAAAIADSITCLSNLSN